jgi:hypothetical protein
LEDGNEGAEGNTGIVFGQFLWGEPALTVAVGQFFELGLELRIGLERDNSAGRLGCETIRKRRNETVENGGR